ncbi:hypothetical protein PROFUN_16728, partial [Planoprotostelium fungivorum]
MVGATFLFLCLLSALVLRGQCGLIPLIAGGSITATADLSVICVQMSNSVLVYSPLTKTVYQNITSSQSSISGDSRFIIAVKQGRLTEFSRIVQSYGNYWSEVRLSHYTFYAECKPKSLYPGHIGPNSDGTNTHIIFPSHDGRRFVVMSTDGRQRFFDGATNDYVQSMTTLLPEPMFNRDLSVMIFYINYTYVVTSVDWTNKRMATQPIPVDYIAPVTAVNSEGTAFVAFDTLYRKSGGDWIASPLDRSFTFVDFSGDDRYLLASSTRGHIVRYLVSDVTRSHLPRMSLSDPNSFATRPLILSNIQGDQILIQRTDGLVYSSNLPLPPYDVRGVCNGDIECQRGLICSPAHYCYTPKTTSIPDHYTVSPMDFHRRVVISFDSISAVDCIAAGSSPVGVTDFFDFGGMRHAHNNTRLQLSYYDGNEQRTRMVDHIEYLSPSRDNVVMIVPTASEKRVELWLTGVCQEKYANSPPRVISLQLPDVATDGNESVTTASLNSTRTVEGTGSDASLSSMAATIDIGWAIALLIFNLALSDDEREIQLLFLFFNVKILVGVLGSS